MGDQNYPKCRTPVASESGLNPAVQRLISQIFSYSCLKEACAKYGVTNPTDFLETVNPEFISRGYDILAHLDKAVKENDEKAISRFSAEFKTLVPRTGNSPRNVKEIAEGADFLDALVDIDFTYRVLKENCDKALDRYYLSLKTDIEACIPNDPDYRLVQEYIENSRGPNWPHAFQIEVKNVFAIKRNGESQRFLKHKGLSNHTLFLHGTRMINLASILTNGMKIAPTSVSLSGASFGNGIYFTDMSAKAAFYCSQTAKRGCHPIGFILVCTVALGEYEEYVGPYSVSLPLSGHKTSVKGLGSTRPTQANRFLMRDGTIVPVANGRDFIQEKTRLDYNEYVVYDVEQILIKYLVELEFKVPSD